MKVNKLIRDGKVGVILSPSHGSPWSAARGEFREYLMFDRELVELVLSGRPNRASAVATKVTDLWLNGDDLIVEWVPVGTRFIIDEYDGWEFLVIRDEIEWEVA